MLKVNHSKNKFYYALLTNPVSRVLKAQGFIRSMNSLTDGGKVLDYGSGDGPYRVFLKQKFDEYMAADYPVTNVHHEGVPDITISEDQKLGVSDNEFDCVILTEVLEHIYKPHDALAEIRRVLKPGGYIAGTVPFFMWEHEAPYDFHRYTYFALQRMFEEQGFEIIRLDYVGDTVGALAYLHSKVLGTFIKPFKRIPLIPYLLTLLIRIPEFCYYLLTKVGFVKKVFSKYFGQFPFGFVFLVQKNSRSL